MAFTKLQNNKGFTMTELLCVVAILVIVTACLVTGIKLAGDTYSSSVKYSEAQTLATTLTELISDELRYTTTKSGQLTVASKVVKRCYIPSQGRYGYLCLGTEKVSGGVRTVTEGKKGQLYSCVEDNGKTLYYNVLGSGSYTYGCKISGLSIKYSSSKFTVSFSIVDSKGEVLNKTTFQVRPLDILT